MATIDTKPAEQIIAKVLDGKLSTVDGAVKLTEAYPGLSLNDAGPIVGGAYYGEEGFIDALRDATDTLTGILSR